VTANVTLHAQVYRYDVPAPVGRCVSSGDPHVITFDGLYYIIYSTGTFIYARNLSSDVAVEVSSAHWDVLKLPECIKCRICGRQQYHWIGFVFRKWWIGINKLAMQLWSESTGYTFLIIQWIRISDFGRWSGSSPKFNHLVPRPCPTPPKSKSVHNFYSYPTDRQTDRQQANRPK